VENIKLSLASGKKSVIIIISVILIILVGIFIYQKFSANEKSDSTQEIDLSFDANGPYAQLFPRKDGNALILNIKRTSSYDLITYDLSYTSLPDETVVAGSKILDGEDSGSTESIDRGVSGTINTSDKKGEYEQEILFGTCSKQVCKYDKGVENGTLILHIRKGNKAYRMITQWHLQKPDIALGNLESGDSHFSYKVNAEREDLANTAYSIVNDLTAVPKLPSGKAVLGKVYALNVPIAKKLHAGEVTIELAENPQEETKIYRFAEGTNEWIALDTKVEGSKLSSKGDGAGIFAVLAPKK
jgi:hypothetical protein